MPLFEASVAMVLSDNTGVADDDKVCVERVDDCFCKFGFLVLGFACSGPFSLLFWHVRIITESTKQCRGWPHTIKPNRGQDDGGIGLVR